MPALANILCLDTSGDRSVVGLRVSTGETFEAETDANRKHGRDLLPIVRDLMARAGVRGVELDLIGVGLGPGSYTGMRIGLTAARTLAYASDARLVGLDGLEAIAQNAPADAPRVLVVGDAQRGDVYAAEFVREAPGLPLVATGPSRIEPLGSWSARIAAEDFLLGPGLKGPAIRAAVGDRPVDPESPIHRPSGRRLVDLALRTAESEAPGDPWALEPNYLRRSAAEDQWDARAAQV